jgi:type I restriction enzyme S subunit
MATEWQQLSLRDAGVSLIDCEHRTPPAASDGYVYVAIPQIKGGHVELTEARRISREHFAEWTRKALPRANDVILSRRCNPGKTAWVPPALECALGQNLVLLRSDGRTVFPPFLRWLVRGPEWWEQIDKFLNVGAIFDSLRCADVPNFKLMVPPLAEQRAIANILGTLDDKIELNRRLNQTLEAMARAIFKSWFVNFDPVRAKAEGRQPPGLDPATAALFPDSFEDSAMGKIPKGWQLKPTPEVFEVNPTRSLAKGALAPYLDMANMPTTSVRAVGWEHRAFGSGMKFSNGDTLVARITPCLENGKTAFVDFLADGQVAWGSTEYIVLRPKPPIPPEYAYFLARTDDFRAHAIQNMTGTSGRQRVPASCFDKFFVVQPSEGICRAFGNFAANTIEGMKRNDEESSTLIETRDVLLPKLLSGEI